MFCNFLVIWQNRNLQNYWIQRKQPFYS